MKLLVLLVCCLSVSWADSLAEETELAGNKISSSKLNSIPSTPAQKTTLSPQRQYVPQYVLPQKQVSLIPQHVQQQQQPPAMYIIAQPGGGSNSPLFQQAVHQLLNYYNSNPQARLQLLQQQGGIPQNVPQSPLPSGALHVVPSPQLEQNLGHLAAVPQGVIPQQSAGAGHQQAVYAIPAQSQFALGPGLLAQLTGQGLPGHGISAQPIAQQLVAQQIPGHQLPAQFITQQIHQSPQFAPQYTHQLPAQYTLSPQLAASLQGQSGLAGNFHLGSLGAQGQFGLKQNFAQALSSNDFAGQADKSSSASSNYSPVYRTAYVKG